MAEGTEMHLLVSKIESGTVIDHIPDWKADVVTKVLRLDRQALMEANSSVAILQNVVSKQLGRKDIVKIDHWHVGERDADMLSLVFPSVTINYIEDGVVTKYKPRVPDLIEGGLKCPELSCISNGEREPVVSKFITLKSERLMRCHYCDTLVGFDSVPEHVRT